MPKDEVVPGGYRLPSGGLPSAAKALLIPENIRAGVHIKGGGVDVVGSYGNIIDLTASMEKTDDADTLSEASMICSGKLVACTFGYKFAVSKAEDRQVLTFDPQYAPPTTISIKGYHLRSGNIQEATFEVRPNGSIWIIGAGTTYMYGKVNHLYWTLP